MTLRTFPPLRELARTHPGGMWRKEIEATASDVGISIRSLNRVSLKLGVVKVRAGRHGTIWRWPASMTRGSASS
jgi:hypothetical protein